MSTTLRLALKEKATLISYLPIFWVACIPLGVSLEAIGLGCALTAILSQEQIWPRIQQNLQAPWVYPLIAIILWTLVGFFWTPKIHHDTWFQLKKLLSFFLIPILMLGFETQKQKEKALQAFLLSSFIPFFMAIAKQYFSWRFHHNDDPGHLFYNHILTGFLLSYGSFIAIEFWFKEKNKLYLLAFVVLSFQLLIINTGKMAYLLYTCLMLFSFWQKTPKKHHLSLLILAAVAGVFLLIFSPAMHQMSLNLKREILDFIQGNKATSFGFRVQFHAFALKLFKEHWLIGSGPGAYTYLFKIINPVPEWPHAPNVHSQYWLILSEQGIIGLCLWIYFTWSLIKTPICNSFYQRLWQGLILILLLNAFTDVILFACPGYLLAAIAAIAFQAPKD
jgi:O-antigen ligase